MDKINSFTVDHTKINKGIYISKIDKDIVTYDIRMVKPNTSPYLENAALHSFEHLFATIIRNSKFSNNVIYFGPMGCRIGFYLLLRDLSHETALNLILDTFKKIISFSNILPGKSIEECGNYLEHDIKKAKIYAKEMYPILDKWKISNLYYKI